MSYGKVKGIISLNSSFRIVLLSFWVLQFLKIVGKEFCVLTLKLSSASSEYLLHGWHYFAHLGPSLLGPFDTCWHELTLQSLGTDWPPTVRRSLFEGIDNNEFDIYIIHDI